MRLEEAKFIKTLRCELEYSYSRIHIEYQLNFVNQKEWWFNPVILQFDNDKDKPHGKTYEGRALCRAAQELLNENWEDEN